MEPAMRLHAGTARFPLGTYLHAATGDTMGWMLMGGPHSLGADRATMCASGRALPSWGYCAASRHFAFDLPQHPLPIPIAPRTAPGRLLHVRSRPPPPSPQVHIANRLVEVGCRHCFAVPGDFNLLLLDQLLKNPDLNMVWCCNELNAGRSVRGALLAGRLLCTRGKAAAGGLRSILARHRQAER